MPTVDDLLLKIQALDKRLTLLEAKFKRLTDLINKATAPTSP